MSKRLSGAAASLGKLRALMTVIEMRLSYLEAVTESTLARARLERAVGRELRREASRAGAGLVAPRPGAWAGPDYSPDGLLRAHLWRDLTSRPTARRPQVGVVLSAGSTRGTAHVGVLQVLEQAGFPIDAVAGTSMGAVFGSLYAAGRPVKRLWEIMAGLKLGDGHQLSTASAWCS